MALPSDLGNIVEVIILNNLANLTAPTPTLLIPAGLESLFNTTVINQFNQLNLPPDLQQLVDTAIVNNPSLLIITT